MKKEDILTEEESELEKKVAEAEDEIEKEAKEEPSEEKKGSPMKKVLVAAVCVLAVLLVIIIADKSGTEDKTITRVSTYTEGNEQKTTIIEYPTRDGSAIITFTMPISYLDEKDRKNLDVYCAENNYISCVIDEGGKTFTVTMKESTHAFKLIGIGGEVAGKIASVLDQKEKYPYAVKLGYYDMEGFSEINFEVDREKFDAAENREEFVKYLASCAIYYQLYTTANEYSCKVIIKDAVSGEIIDARIFEKDNYSLKS